MIGRVVEGLVALGVLASAGILAVMLAAPLVPMAGPAAPSLPVDPTDVPSSTASVADQLPPIGRYQAVAPLGWGGICLGLELEGGSYPTALGARGEATVIWWQAVTSDSANPAACQGRAGPLHEVEAIVDRTFGALGTAGSAVGYRVAFHLPAPDGGEIDMDIGLLTARSSADRIQAVDLMSSGTGLVFERVSEIDPPLVAAPHPSPAAALPSALFLLRGPLEDDGPCLVLDTGPPSGGADERTGAVRWWQPGNPDPTDPTACLSRIGEVQTRPAEIITVSIEGGPGAGTSYAVRFSLQEADGREREVVLDLPSDFISPDNLTAFVMVGEVRRALTFDRVDSIDPPVASPAASP